MLCVLYFLYFVYFIVIPVLKWKFSIMLICCRDSVTAEQIIVLASTEVERKTVARIIFTRIFLSFNAHKRR